MIKKGYLYYLVKLSQIAVNLLSNKCSPNIFCFLGCKFGHDDTMKLDGGMCSNRSSSNKILGGTEAVSMMKSFVLTMIKLIENRIVISDDW